MNRRVPSGSSNAYAPSVKKNPNVPFNIRNECCGLNVNSPTSSEVKEISRSSNEVTSGYKTRIKSYSDAFTSPTNNNKKCSWTVVTPSKYKLDRIKSLSCLKGQKPVKSKMLYVRNIRREDEQNDDEIIKMVKLHAKYYGVRVVSARIIRNRYDDDIVACKITVTDSECQHSGRPVLLARISGVCCEQR